MVNCVARSVSRSVVLLVVVLAGMAGCGGHPWRVVRDGGTPSPLHGVGPVAVSFDYSQLYIDGKNEQQWVQSKLTEDPTYATKWGDLKQAFETNFVAGLSQSWPVQPGPPGAQGGQVVVSPIGMTMGHYMVVAATATSVTTLLNFLVNGQPADQIQVMGAESATIYTPSVHQHMPKVASHIGAVTGLFLKSKN